MRRDPIPAAPDASTENDDTSHTLAGVGARIVKCPHLASNVRSEAASALHMLFRSPVVPHQLGKRAGK